MKPWNRFFQTVYLVNNSKVRQWKYKSERNLEKFKVFIGFKNLVCTNLCISSDGLKADNVTLSTFLGGIRLALREHC